MSRRIARELAVQTLFLLDFNADAGKNEALSAVLAEREGDLPAKSKEYAVFLVEGTKKYLPDIDKYLAGISKEWPLERMPGVDRNIARLALFEMKYSSEPLDVGVAINEAVELAKIFGTESSGRFINGILASVAKKKEVRQEKEIHQEKEVYPEKEIPQEKEVYPKKETPQEKEICQGKD